MTDEKDADIGICWKCNPPLIVPLSKRAKDALRLPTGTDCAIFLHDEPHVVLSAFHEDSVIVSMDDDYRPNLIAAATIKQLH